MQLSGGLSKRSTTRSGDGAPPRRIHNPCTDVGELARPLGELVLRASATWEECAPCTDMPASYGWPDDDIACDQRHKDGAAKAAPDIRPQRGAKRSPARKTPLPRPGVPDHAKFSSCGRWGAAILPEPRGARKPGGQPLLISDTHSSQRRHVMDIQSVHRGHAVRRAFRFAPAGIRPPPRCCPVLDLPHGGRTHHPPHRRRPEPIRRRGAGLRMRMYVLQQQIFVISPLPAPLNIPCPEAL